MRKINKFTYIFLITLLMAGIMPNVVIAWETAQSAETECTFENTAKIKVSFTNKEDKKAIDVIVNDQQTGKSINLGTIEAGQTKTGEIETNKESIEDGAVKFLLTWADGMDGSDKRIAKYKSISCVKPSPTPIATPEPTPTSAPTETPVPTLTPTPTQTPSVGGPGDGRSDGRGGILGVSAGVLGLATTGNYEFILGVISSGLLSLSAGFILRFRKGR